MLVIWSLFVPCTLGFKFQFTGASHRLPVLRSQDTLSGKLNLFRI